MSSGGSTCRRRNINSGKVADVLGPSTADGANVIQYDRTGGTSQRWTFDSVETVRSADDGRP
ncbi:RICIN domain-containing protein [Halopelagius fulvigenes]|uniref:RICIN domain-containing protein n=1 Tax=Halopelagius fulvigenes TaxID=1198324 RepID=A0ABD5TVT2_9EURY